MPIWCWWAEYNKTMKRFLLLLATVGLFAAACEKSAQDVTNDEVGPGNNGGGTSHSIELSCTDVVLSYENDEYEITVTSTCSWSATSTSGWIIINTKTGSAGSKQLSFSVKANESSSSRQGTIVIKSDEYNITQNLYVEQEAKGQDAGDDEDDDNTGASHKIELSEITVNAACEGGNYSVTVASTCPWSVTNSPSWITVNTKTGTAGSKQLSFSVKANESNSSREGTITLKNTYNLTAQLSVVQAASDQGGNGGTSEKRLTRAVINNYDNGETSTSDYTYDDQGRLIKCVVSNGSYGTSTILYEWRDNTIFVRCSTTTDVTYDYFYTYTLNSKGLVETVDYSTNTSDVVLRYTYSYDASNRITGTELNSGTFTSVWAGDNLISWKTSDNYSYEITNTYGGEPYDKKGYFLLGLYCIYSDGVLLTIYPELFGARSKQLPVKSQQIHNKGTQYQTETVYEYAYEFDRDGYISKMTTTSVITTATTTTTTTAVSTLIWE